MITVMVATLTKTVLHRQGRAAVLIGLSYRPLSRFSCPFAPSVCQSEYWVSHLCQWFQSPLTDTSLVLFSPKQLWTATRSSVVYIQKYPLLTLIAAFLLL